MKALKALTGLAFAGLLAIPQHEALAVDAQGQFVLRGIGAQSCGEVSKSIQADPTRARELASWLTGYMSALNRVLKDNYDLVPGTPVEDVYKIVMGICAGNPQSSVETVTGTVLKNLSVARLSAASPMVEARSGDRTVQVRAATLTAMETKLAALGFYKGPADGTFNSKTEKALKKYQEDQKIPVTGVPDTRTVLHMLVETPAAASAAGSSDAAKPAKEKKKKGK